MVSQLSFAQDQQNLQSESFTLEAAKTYALANNISISNAEHDIKSAKQQANEVRGIGLPQVNITGSFNNNLNLPVQVMDASFFNPMAPPGSLVSFRAGTEFSSSATLQASQILFNGSYIIGLKAASYFAKFQVDISNITKEDVVYNVIQAYNLASVAKTNAVFVDSMVVLSETMVEQQKIYYDLGLLLQEDMDQLNFSLLTSKQAKVSADLQYENALNLLKFSMGFPIGNPIEIMETPDELLSTNTISSGDIHSNLTYTMMEKQITLSQLDLRNKQFANLPNLNAYYQHAYNAYRNEFDFFDPDQQWFLQSSWGLQLNVPVFSGGQRHAVTAQAKIKVLKDENSLTQMERTLQMQEAQAKNNYYSAQSKSDLMKQNVDLARSIYENSVVKDQIGEGTSILVTQKYNQLIVAQSQYVGSMIDLFQAQLALDKIYNNILQNQ